MGLSNYRVSFTTQARKDLGFWKKSGNLNVIKKIEQLILAAKENPFEGIGKPEQLKYDLAGKWSRRINHEHRLVYSVDEDLVTFHSLRGHY